MQDIKEYYVLVGRIVREDIVIKVQATSPQNAVDLAIDEATIEPPEEWHCYDCEYFADENYVKLVDESNAT